MWIYYCKIIEIVKYIIYTSTLLHFYWSEATRWNQSICFSRNTAFQNAGIRKIFFLFFWITWAICKLESEFLNLQRMKNEFSSTDYKLSHLIAIQWKILSKLPCNQTDFTCNIRKYSYGEKYSHIIAEFFFCVYQKIFYQKIIDNFSKTSFRAQLEFKCCHL